MTRVPILLDFQHVLFSVNSDKPISPDLEQRLVTLVRDCPGDIKILNILGEKGFTEQRINAFNLERERAASHYESAVPGSSNYNLINYNDGKVYQRGFMAPEGGTVLPIKKVGGPEFPDYEIDFGVFVAIKPNLEPGHHHTADEAKEAEQLTDRLHNMPFAQRFERFRKGLSKLDPAIKKNAVYLVKLAEFSNVYADLQDLEKRKILFQSYQETQ